MSAIPLNLRKLVHERDEERCQRCGRHIGSGPRSLQHRRPRGMGGSKHADTAANLILVCGTGTTLCHGWMESERTEALRLGFLVKQCHDPATRPVFRYLRGWELPTDTGWIPSTPPDDFETSEERNAA